MQDRPDLCLHGLWTDLERTRSSTFRELTAVLRILSDAKEHLVGHKIKWFTDNSSVPSIIKCGSARTHLQDIAFEIFSICHSNNIIIIPEWVPIGTKTQ